MAEVASALVFLSTAHMCPDTDVKFDKRNHLHCQCHQAHQGVIHKERSYEGSDHLSSGQSGTRGLHLCRRPQKFVYVDIEFDHKLIM